MKTNLDLQDTKNKISLVSRLKSGDMEPLLNWLELNHVKLYKIGWSYLYNTYDIEDAVQNTALKIYKNIHKLRNPQFFDTWSISIFMNECRRILRDKKRTESFENHVPKSDFGFNEETLDLLEAIEKLEPSLKDIIILKFLAGYSQEEAAEILSIPLGTVKSRSHRAIGLLKKELTLDNNSL